MAPKALRGSGRRQSARGTDVRSRFRKNRRHYQRRGRSPVAIAILALSSLYVSSPRPSASIVRALQCGRHHRPVDARRHCPRGRLRQGCSRERRRAAHHIDGRNGRPVASCGLRTASRRSPNEIPPPPLRRARASNPNPPSTETSAPSRPCSVTPPRTKPQYPADAEGGFVQQCFSAGLRSARHASAPRRREHAISLGGVHLFAQ